MAKTLGLSSVGLEMGVAVAIGYGIGWALDRHFDSEPVATIIFLLFGVAAGFKGLMRAAREAKGEMK